MTVTQLPRLAAPADDAPPGPGPRWVPSRAGILNVWRYYDEVFTFHEGRLLLRGPNGSGKSKALELLLPFLLDANLRPSRLSTFGTGERTMHWNLMGEGASGTTRVGYVWLEFRRPGPGYEPDRWFSCGARLQASTHTTAVHADYFTTRLRIGAPDGLALVNEAGQPLTKGALEERLGNRGAVHDNAGDYRAAVRAELFPGLTEQRYEALITALLQLRTPKLSQRLDPALLSTLLSRALPPLGQQEITELAEGFERLDRQRERLKALDEEVAATRTLAARQQAYARRVLRASAAVLISATSELEKLSVRARQSAEEHDRVAAGKEAAEQRSVTLEDALGQIEAQITGITRRDAYTKGEELDRLRQEAFAAQQQATALRADAGRKRSEAEADAAGRDDAQRTADQQASSVRAGQTEAQHAAARAGLASVYGEIAAGPGSGEVQGSGEGQGDGQGGGRGQGDGRGQSDGRGHGRARALLRAAVRGRHDQLAAVRLALGAHERAVERREHAEADLDEARTALAGTREQQAAADQQHEAALTRLHSRLAVWAASCRELTFPDLDALLSRAPSEPAVIALVDSAAAVILDAIAQAEALAGQQKTATRRQRDELVQQISTLTTEQFLPPAAPPARTADRRAMTGAPFWRLVDFASPAADGVQGPVEAALQAAGLLDAWVGPSGSVHGHDIFADPGALGPAPGRSLADVLVPEQNDAVPTEIVRRLLAAVAYGEQLPPGHPAAIGADGSWRLASLSGSWHKDEPAYIGMRARERARAERIRQLNADIDACDATLATLDGELGTLRTRRAVVDNERHARPDHGELHDATQAVTQASADVAAADRTVRRRLDILADRERAATGARQALAAAAAEHGAPADRTALDALAGAVDRFGDQAESWLDGQAQLEYTRRELGHLASQAERAAAAARQREQEAGAAEHRHRQLAATLDGIEATVGAEYREILATLETLRARRDELSEQLRAARADVPRLAGELGALTRQQEGDAAARDAATVVRDGAAHRFRHLATGVLGADSGIDDPARFMATLTASDGIRAALDAARQVAAAWPTVPYAPNNLGDALHRLSEAVHQCRSTLSARADLDLETDEDVQVFTALVNGVRAGATELLNVLTEESGRSRHDITEQERELFDQTLTGDTRRHLADRIRQANELVDRMNARLERVRTASKVAVRLVWQVAPELPPGTRAARDLLLKDPVRLTEADREALHRFFRERIEQAKTDDTAASWEQQLAQVFDYTAWHQFVVKVDRANGAGWQLLTRKLHGALSGGEKAIALHLPLFAAVAAHYQAVPGSPRIILLDEVFVGVDTSNRGQVFALLSALDLDLVLTSDHEWCTYAELSGISIHQLITGSDGDGDDAVTTAQFVWNGRDLLPRDAEPAGR